MVETKSREEILTLGVDLIRQEGDALEILLLGEINHIAHQHAAISLTSMLWQQNDILHQDHETTFRRADRK